MKQIIKNVKQTIAQKKIMWAYPIALELQKHHYSLAIQWAVKCIQIYSSEIESDKFSELNIFIQQARNSKDVLTCSQCLEISKEIWYLPGREEIQTAISQLWGSIAAFQDGDKHVGVMQTIAAVGLVLPDISDDALLDQYMKAAVRIYEEYESPS